MAIFTVTSGAASDLAVVTVSPVVSDCSTYYQWNITANSGDSINFQITGNHFESRYIRNGAQTNFTDGAATTYDNSLSVGFLLLNSGTTGVFSSATIRITNTTTNKYYETTVTRENDDANCYDAATTVTKTSDLLNDGENATSTFIEFSDLDATPTNSSTNPVESNGVFDAIEAVKDADVIVFDPYLTITSTDVQAAIEELKDEVDGFTLPGGIMLQSTYDTNGNNIVDNAEDSQLFDGLDSTQFLRSDTADTKSAGDLTFASNVKNVFNIQSELYSNASHTILDLLSGNLIIQDNTTDRFTFDRTTGNLAVTGDVTVSDEAYSVSWNGSLEVPTKNAVYDQIQVIASGGEVNTASNLTGDEGIFAQKSSQDLEFKSLTAGTGISLSSDANAITITATGSGAVDSVFGRTGTVTAVAGDYDAIYARIGSTTVNGDNYLYQGRNSANPTFYINQIGSGDIARFFKGSGISDSSSATQVTITNTGGITATGVISGNGSGLNSVNAATLDSIDSTQFLRSDAADTKSVGDLTFAGNIKATFNVQSELYSNTSHTILDLLSGSFYIQDNATDRFTFDRTTGNLTLTGNVIFDGGAIMSSGGTGTGAYFDSITGNNWVIRGSSNGSNFSGLWIDSSNHGQLLLRDSSGNLDIQLRADNTSLFNNSILLQQDSAEVRFGAGADFRMYHSGTENRIDNYNSMNLQLRQDTTERFEFDMTTGALKFAAGNTPDADDLSVSTLNAIYTTANFSGSTNYPTQFGQTLVVRGNDGSDGNRNIYLHKVNGDNHQYYLGYDDSTTGAEFTRVWTDDYNSGDNLGDHTATQALDMAGFDITDVGDIGGESVSLVNSVDADSLFDIDIDSNGYGSITARYSATGGRLDLTAGVGIASQYIRIDGTNQAITAPFLSTADIIAAGNTSLTTKEYVDAQASSLPYDYYFAGGISQSGTSAPTATFSQTAGIGTSTWSRVATGVYRLTRSSGSYDVSRTHVTLTLDAGLTLNQGLIDVTTGYIQVTITNTSGTNTDGIFEGSIHIIEFP